MSLTPSFIDTKSVAIIHLFTGYVLVLIPNTWYFACPLQKKIVHYRFVIQDTYIHSYSPFGSHQAFDSKCTSQY